MSCQTIEEVPVLPLSTKPTITLTPQTLLMVLANKISMNVTSGNAWTNRIPRQISRTGVDGSIPISTEIDSVISKFYTPSFSDSAENRGSGTSIYVGDTSPPCGLNMRPDIDNIQQSATPYLRKSNELNTSINQEFTNIPVSPPIFTEVISDKLSKILDGISTCAVV